MQTAKISKHSWNYIVDYMDFEPDERNIYETTEENGNYLSVSVVIDGWYKVTKVEVEMWDADGNRLEMDADQYALLCDELDEIASNMKQEALAEAQYERWLLGA